MSTLLSLRQNLLLKKNWKIGFIFSSGTYRFGNYAVTLNLFILLYTHSIYWPKIDSEHQDDLKLTFTCVKHCIQNCFLSQQLAITLISKIKSILIKPVCTNFEPFAYTVYSKR